MGLLVLRPHEIDEAHEEPTGHEHCAEDHDGPDADPDNEQDMDLTNPKRAARNPDGVVFYKVWNGRQKPKMPAFKDKLTKDQVWHIVSFVQTLRQPSSSLVAGRSSLVVNQRNFTTSSPIK